MPIKIVGEALLPEVVFAGRAVRDGIFKIMENYGICRGAHNYPQILTEIAGQYVWWFGGISGFHAYIHLLQVSHLGQKNISL